MNILILFIPIDLNRGNLKVVLINIGIKNTAIEATQWLIEEQLKWDESEVKEHLNYKSVFR